MATSSLNPYKGRIVSLDELHAMPTGPSLGPRHLPMNFGQFADALKHEAESRDYRITKEQYALGGKNHRVFGVMNLELRGVVQHVERTLALGFRSSDNKSLGAVLVAGTSVAVCENLSLSGDMVAMKKKNTTGLRIAEALKDAFDKFKQHASALDIQIARLQATEINDEQAKGLAYDVFAKRIVPMHLFDDVDAYYFRPTADMTDCTPRTKWGLVNAFTRAFKKLSPDAAFGYNVALGRVLGLSAEPVIDVIGTTVDDAQ